MNRLNAHIIKYNEPIKQALIEAEIYFEQAEPCPQLNEKVLFVEEYPFELLNLNPDFIIGKFGRAFVCFFDNGKEEVRVQNNEYINYDLKTLYEKRTGKYDIIDELI